MPEIVRKRGSARGVRTVAGIFGCLVDRERARFERVDPRWSFTAAGRAGAPPPPEWRNDRRPLDSVEAGEPQWLQGRELRMMLPPTWRRREDAFEWFEVRADDTIRLCEPPPD